MQKEPQLPWPGSQGLSKPVETSHGKGNTASLSWIPKYCPPQWRSSVKEVGHSFPNLIFQALFDPEEAIHGRRRSRIPSQAPHSVSGPEEASRGRVEDSI